MTRSELRQLGITVIACALTATGILWWSSSSNRKIAVVDAVQLFNGFKMKQEMEAKAGGRLQYLAQRADSLKKEFAVKRTMKDIPQTDLEQLYKAFSQAQGNLEQEYQQSNQTINEQVWKRLNPLVDAYGKEQGLRLIIGANGMGSVLYNDAYYDRTKEVTAYVNKKYEEGN